MHTSDNSDNAGGVVQEPRDAEKRMCRAVDGRAEDVITAPATIVIEDRLERFELVTLEFLEMLAIRALRDDVNALTSGLFETTPPAGLAALPERVTFSSMQREFIDVPTRVGVSIFVAWRMYQGDVLATAARARRRIRESDRPELFDLSAIEWPAPPHLIIGDANV